MSETITFTIDELRPPREAVLGHQGIPPGRTVSSGIESLFAAGVELLEQTAAPRGVFAEISKEDFTRVYAGEGLNDERTPVGEIFPHAARLGLFAVTLGKPVVDEIRCRFDSNQLALGAMLDSAASIAADQLANRLIDHVLPCLAAQRPLPGGVAALNYSPGYCGWHISGQKKLFEYLQPESIGITLRESFLMDPLKSVSGVLIVGSPEIHRFAVNYPFCKSCATRGCRERIRALCTDLARESAEES